jgi:hypothetical protein
MLSDNAESITQFEIFQSHPSRPYNTMHVEYRWNNTEGR